MKQSWTWAPAPGIDVFLAAKKVGEQGRVIGVDMTEDMVARGRQLAQEHGFGNVEFRLGEIEHLPLDALPWMSSSAIASSISPPTSWPVTGNLQGPQAWRPDTHLGHGDFGRFAGGRAGQRRGLGRLLGRGHGKGGVPGNHPARRFFSRNRSFESSYEAPGMDERLARENHQRKSTRF